MPWQMLWPDFLKKRLCRYLLQHYLGHFFKEKISLEQLSIDIYNGTGCVKNLNLDCDALNEQINAAASATSSSSSSSIPIEIVSGFVGYISVYIPWHDLFNDYCKLTIKNVQITIRTKQRKMSTHSAQFAFRNNIRLNSDLPDNEHSNSSSMFSSMFIDSIMSTSMHIAQECLNESEINELNQQEQTDPDDSILNQNKNNSLLGLEAFASTIDSILSRIKINLEQIQIRIENLDSFNPVSANIMSSSTVFNHKPSNGIALELRIKSIKYFDIDSAQQQQQQQHQPGQAQQSTAADNLIRNTTKSFTIEGLTVYFDEFIVRDDYDPSAEAASSETDNLPNDTDLSLNSTIDQENSSSVSVPVDESAPFNFELNPNYYLYTNPIIFVTFSGIQTIKLTINNMRPSEMMNDASEDKINARNQQRPLMEINAQFGSIRCLVCPKQIHLLGEMIQRINDYIETGKLMKKYSPNKSVAGGSVRGYTDKRKFDAQIQSDLFQSANPNEQSTMFYSMMSDSMTTTNNLLEVVNEANIPDENLIDDENQTGAESEEPEIEIDDQDKCKVQFTRKLKQTIEQLQNDVIVANTNKSHTSRHNLFQTFKLTFRMFSLTCLHHDPAINSKSESSTRRLIVERMKPVSDQYFDWVSTIDTTITSSMSSSFGIDKNTITKYHQACALHDHFLVLLKPINLNLIQKINQHHLLKHQYSLNDLSITVGYIQLNEFLVAAETSTASQPSGRVNKRLLRSAQLIEAYQSGTVIEIVHFTETNPNQLEQACFKMQMDIYEPLDKSSDIPQAFSSKHLNDNDQFIHNQLLQRQFENICINLNQCLVCELDISIIDRLYYLINDISAPVKQNNSNINPSSMTDSAIIAETHRVRNFELKCSQQIRLALRFPIADLRRTKPDQSTITTSTIAPPLSAKSMISFRCLRDQILTLHIFDFHFQTLLNPPYFIIRSNLTIPLSELLLTITCSQINMYYQYSKSERPIHFALIQQKLNEPRSLICSIKLQTPVGESVAPMPNQETDYDSLKHNYNINIAKANKFFSRNSTIKEENETDEINLSRNTEDADDNGNEEVENDEEDDNDDDETYGPFSRIYSLISSEKNRRIVNAGNKSEMNTFIQESKQNSQTCIRLHLPDLKCLIVDQRFLNDIYNCFLNDLIMWVPTQVAPLESSNVMPYNIEGFSNKVVDSEEDDDLNDDRQFQMCRSAILKSSSIKTDSDCCESEDESSYRHKNTKKSRSSNKNKSKSAKNLAHSKAQNQKNTLCLVLSLDKAHLKTFVLSNVQSPEVSQSTTAKYGEFDIKTGNFQLCVALSESPKNKDFKIEKQYICLFTDQINISHSSKTTATAQFKASYPTNYASFENLFQTSKTRDLITSNDPSINSALFASSDTPQQTITVPMVSIAIKSKFNTKTNTKQLLVALNFNNLMLHHLFCAQTDFWIFQLILLFDLIDIDIVGYEVPIVLTELHLNVSNSCVVYKPLHLPTRSLIAFKSLHWSSNVTAESSLTLLVFNIENIYLFLSKSDAQEGINLKRDYICVANSDLFELRLLISDEEKKKLDSETTATAAFTRKCPILDIKIRSNLIQIRTCVDSAFALIELINYIVSDGDLHMINPAGQVSTSPQPEFPTTAPNTSALQLDYSAVTDELNNAIIDTVAPSAMPTLPKTSSSIPIKSPSLTITNNRGAIFTVGTPPTPLPPPPLSSFSFKSSSSSNSLSHQNYYSPLKQNTSSSSCHLSTAASSFQEMHKPQLLQSPSLSFDSKLKQNPISSSAESIITDMVKEAISSNPMVQSVYGSLNTQPEKGLINSGLSTKTLENNLNSDSEEDNDDDDEIIRSLTKHQQSHDDDEFQFDMPFGELNSLSPLKSAKNSSVDSSLSYTASSEMKLTDTKHTKNKRRLFFKPHNDDDEDDYNQGNDEDNNDEDENDNDLLKDFDIIDAIPGFGEPPKNNQEFEIKHLMRENSKRSANLNNFIEIKQDHFKKPLTKIDVLKAPDSYPVPLNVYCIQEISINWCLYGGSDFGSGNPVQNNQEPQSTEPPLRTSPLSINRTVSSPVMDSVSNQFSRSRNNSTSSTNSLSISPHSLSQHYQSPPKPITNPSISTTSSVKFSTKSSSVSFTKEKYIPRKVGGRITTKYDVNSLNWIARGGRQRNLSVCMEVALHKVKTKIDLYADMSNINQEPSGAPDSPYLYRVALAIGDIEIRDKLVSSAFNMFLFRYESDHCPKHTNSNMIFLKFLCSKSMDAQRLLECDIKMSIQPLRFNIDHDAIIFLVEYFTNMASKDLNEFSKNLIPPPAPVAAPAQDSINESSAQQTPQQIYIRNFIFSPDLLIKFDFAGKYDKRPDNKMDTMTKLLLVVVQLSNAEIKLKRVYYRRGYLGAEKLFQALIKEWQTDILRNQKNNLIKGWGIFNSLIQFFEGFTYLIWYPIEQYRRDGRVLCGIQRGSAAFSTCTVLATIELTNRMFQATKNVAEFFYDLVTPHRANSHHYHMMGLSSGSSPFSSSSNVLMDTILSVSNNRNIRYRRQPNDIREGLSNAYYVMYEGFNDTAANFIQEVNQGAEHKGIPGAIGGAIRQLPSAALAPIVLIPEATCNILSGIKNQLKPDEKRDDDHKWKTIAFNS